jgi:hypothetical protein
MKVYDNYEISPCTRTEEPATPGKFYFEVCEPEEADVWTLYGHIEGEGVEAVGDFSSREAAERVYTRITGLPFPASYEANTRLGVMHAAPRLLNACRMVVERWESGDLAEAALACQEGIAEATNAAVCVSCKPIIIEVLGGVVQEVRNVPPGIEYEILDHDDLEEQETTEEKDASPLGR